MIKLLITDRSGQNHELDAETDQTLMQNLQNQTYGVEAICGGLCSCGTCHVYIGETWLDKIPEMGAEEDELLEGVFEREPNSRLSCQIPITDELDGMDLTIAPSSF
jgi:2Fe-2S ferredoxin